MESKITREHMREIVRQLKSAVIPRTNSSFVIDRKTGNLIELIDMTLAHQINPARCKKSIDLSAVEKEWTKDPAQWRYEVKEDGRRYLLQIRPNGAKINYLTSRRVSVVTKEFVEKQDSVPFVRKFQFLEAISDTIIDGEWCGGETSNEVATSLSKGEGYYVYWDVLRYKDVDVRKRPLSARMEMLNRLEYNFPPWMRRIKSFFDPKAGLAYVDIQNLEGLVRKDIHQPYGEGWTKAKRSETHDVIIWGYEKTKSEDWAAKGWIGALLIGQWRKIDQFKRSPVSVSVSDKAPVPGVVVRREEDLYEFVDCGRASGFTNKLRDKFSKNKKKYQGQVIEIECKMRFPTGKFRHPEFSRLRDDKNPWECIWEPKIKEQD